MHGALNTRVKVVKMLNESVLCTYAMCLCNKYVVYVAEITPAV